MILRQTYLSLRTTASFVFVENLQTNTLKKRLHIGQIHLIAITKFLQYLLGRAKRRGASDKYFVFSLSLHLLNGITTRRKLKASKYAIIHG